MNKRIIGIIVSLVLVAMFALAAVWIVGNFDTAKQGMGGVNLYTQQDVDNAYKDGYDTALADKLEYEILITGYRDTVTILNDKISNLNMQVTQLTSQVTILTTGNNDKAAAIALLNAQIEMLQTSAAALTAQVSNLTASISSLTTDNIALNALITQLQAHGTSAQVTITQLNSLIVYLSGIINDWENRTEFVVKYHVIGSVWDMQVISNPNIRPSLPTTPVGNWTFKGWSLDGVTVIDPMQVSVVTDINFHAVIECNVEFNFDGGLYGSPQMVKYGAYAIEPNEPQDENVELIGWSVDGVNAVNLQTYQIIENTVFYALVRVKTWEQVYSGRYKLHNTGIKTGTFVGSFDLLTLFGVTTQNTNVKIYFESVIGEMGYVRHYVCTFDANGNLVDTSVISGIIGAIEEPSMSGNVISFNTSYTNYLALYLTKIECLV